MINKFLEGFDERKFDDENGRNTPCPYSIKKEKDWADSWVEGYNYIDSEEYMEDLKFMNEVGKEDLDGVLSEDLKWDDYGN